MGEPGRQAVSGIVAHGAHLGLGAEGVGYSLRRAFVIGRECDAHMAIVEDRIARPIGFFDLIERLGDQEGAQAVTGHESQGALEEVEPAERGKLVEHQQDLSAAIAVDLAVQLLGQPAADLVENEPDKRLGPRNVGWRNNEVKRDRLLRIDQVRDAPVASRCHLRHGWVAIKT